MSRAGLTRLSPLCPPGGAGRGGRWGAFAGGEGKGVTGDPRGEGKTKR